MIVFVPIKLFGYRKLVKMSEAIDDMEAFTVLTDSVIYAIAFHPDEKLKKVVIVKHLLFYL